MMGSMARAVELQIDTTLKQLRDRGLGGTITKASFAHLGPDDFARWDGPERRLYLEATVDGRLALRLETVDGSVPPHVVTEYSAFQGLVTRFCVSEG